MGTVEDPGPGYKLVRDTFNAVVPGATDEVWNNTLRDGFVAKTAYPAATTAFQCQRALSLLAALPDVAAPIADRDGSHLPALRQDRRWPLYQQRLAPGSSRSRFQGDLGQCRPHQRQDRQGTQNQSDRGG